MAAAAQSGRFVMMPATRDAITKLFERPGRASLERDEDGVFWAGGMNREGKAIWHASRTSPAEAIEKLLADPDLAPVTLEEAARP